MLKFPGSGTKSITDLSGQQFGRLVVLWPAGYDSQRHIRWLCQCSCLAFAAVDAQSLRSGHTKSCGCGEIDNRFIMNRKHGHSSQAHGMTPELRCYFHSKARCENKNDRKYPNYGGRGISFFFKSFEEFFKELGFRPSPKHSIDRINNDGHYEPGNVRWATSKEQRANQRPITPHYRRPATAETRKKLSEASRRRKPHKHTPATIEQMRISARARVQRQQNQKAQSCSLNQSPLPTA